MITLPELKEHLNVWHTLHDAYLVDLERAAVELSEQYFGYLGEEQSFDEYIIGTGVRDLFLQDAPSDPDVVVTEATAPGESAVEITDFVLRGRRLRRTGGGVWTRDYEYHATYMRGYAPGAQPERAHMAVRFLVAHWYTHRTPVSAANASTMPMTVKDLLPVNPVIA